MYRYHNLGTGSSGVLYQSIGGGGGGGGGGQVSQKQFFGPSGLSLV